MSSNMEREDQDRILDYLNRHNLPFPRYHFTRDEKYGHMKRLGSGGGGAVYAVQNRLGDEYAVKIIGFQIPPIADPRVIRECELEIQTQRQVSRNCREIVQIEDAQVLSIGLNADYNVLHAEEMSDGPLDAQTGLFLFILMEKLQPVNTAREGVIPRLRGLDPDEVLKFATDIGRALRAAHNHPKKIIHRDVKPENIFWDELNQIYKLGDFGIAKATQLGERMTTGPGTADYRAPEVRMGGTYDVRADIYSYGVMLYKLLNHDWNSAHLYHAEDLHTEPAGGTAALKKVVMKACAYDPEDRYSSMNALLADLEAIQRDVPAPKEPTPAKEPKPERAPAVPVSLQLTEKGNVAPSAPEKAPQKVAEETPKLKLTQGNRAASSPAPAAPVKASATPAAPVKTPEQPLKKPADEGLSAKNNDKAPQKAEEKTISRYERRSNIAVLSLGIMGMLFLLLAVLGCGLLPGKLFLPKTSAWQTYVALALALLGTWVLLPLKGEYFYPVFMPLFTSMETPLRLLAWLLAFGFNLYTFFALNFCWLFLFLAVCLLLGSKGMLMAADLGALALLLISLVDLPLQGLPENCLWLLPLLFVLGIRYSLSYANGYLPLRLLHHCYPSFFLRAKHNIIFALLVAAAGVSLYFVNLIPGVALPELVTLLHPERSTVLYLIFCIIDQVLQEYIL